MGASRCASLRNDEEGEPTSSREYVHTVHVKHDGNNLKIQHTCSQDLVQAYTDAQREKQRWTLDRKHTVAIND